MTNGVKGDLESIEEIEKQLRLAQSGGGSREVRQRKMATATLPDSLTPTPTLNLTGWLFAGSRREFPQSNRSQPTTDVDHSRRHHDQSAADLR